MAADPGSDGSSSPIPADKIAGLVSKVRRVKRARLVVVHGDGTDGTMYGIPEDEAGLGRTDGAILFPEDDLVSPSHARFLYKKDRLFVRDEGSANDIYIDCNILWDPNGVGQSSAQYCKIGSQIGSQDCVDAF